MNIYTLHRDIIREAKMYTVTSGEALAYTRESGFEIVRDDEWVHYVKQAPEHFVFCRNCSECMSKRRWNIISDMFLEWLESEVY